MENYEGWEVMEKEDFLADVLICRWANVPMSRWADGKKLIN